MKRTPAALICGIIIAAAIIGTLRGLIGHLLMPNFVPITASSMMEPIRWTLWLALAPLLVTMVRRFPIGVGASRRNLLAHGGALGLLAPIHGVALAYISFRLILLFDATHMRGGVRWNPSVAIAGASIDGCWDYVIIVGLYFAFRFHQQYRDGELAAARLERTLATARLDALQSQLQPHFLFNVLHSTASLAITDGPAARDMLVRLGDLLRRTLSAGRRFEVPLSEELDFLERYLAIEQVRFSDRLITVFDVDERALGASVPSLLLQPLAENAIRHGIAAHGGRGTLTIRARVGAESLTIEIEDDGPGFPPDWTERASTGIGISNVRARLHELFGPAAELLFLRAAGGGAIVRARCPARLAAT